MPYEPLFMMVSNLYVKLYVCAVAAVADGLKAWELLKGRPHNVDLILTEVDLPSISGYALLSLIMEHDTCKNIPVISMLLPPFSFCYCYRKGLSACQIYSYSKLFPYLQ